MGGEVVYYTCKEQTDRPKAGKENNMNKTYSAILDYLCSVADSIPCTINSPEVTYIWETPTGKKYGLTSVHAQALEIISERIGERNTGGILYRVESVSNYVLL